VPVTEVVWLVHDWLAGVAPLNVKELIEVLTENPVPLTVTVIPVGPWAGVSVIVGVVMVKVAVAVSDPPSLPVATALWLPAASTGTMKVHENVPVADVVWLVQVWVPGVAPLNLNEVIPVLTENPVPLTVTVIPVGPREGVRVIVGVVMVKLAVAVSDPPSLPVATTLYGPAAIDGTVNVQEKAPTPEVVWLVHDWLAGVAPLNVNALIPVLTENPEPLTVTVTPVGPWDGVSIIVGVVIVKVAVSVSDPPSVPAAITS
jgi:hypothetical protein